MVSTLTPADLSYKLYHWMCGKFHSAGIGPNWMERWEGDSQIIWRY